MCKQTLRYKEISNLDDIYMTAPMTDVDSDDRGNYKVDLAQERKLLERKDTGLHQ